MDGTTGTWSDLPNDILEKIAKCVDTAIDVLRFRAVCKSWRSSRMPFKKFPITPLNLPLFSARKYSHPEHRGAYFILTERTVYRIQSPESKEPWLVKIESSENGKLRLLNPVSHHPIKIRPRPTQMPKVLNTLDFRISEVCKTYALQYVNPSEPTHYNECKYAKKVVVSAGGRNSECIVLAIDDADRLWHIKLGDKKWTRVRERFEINQYHDVVNYKGQFIGIDLRRRIWLFDSMFQRTPITYNRSRCYHVSTGHLVELYDGELFLVEEIFHKDETCKCARNDNQKIVIFRIDKQNGEWVEVKPVFDQIIFAGDDCSFSICAEGFEGCQGTRVFYADEHIFLRTETLKELHYHYLTDGRIILHLAYGTRDCDYGYNSFECLCSSDDDVGKDDAFILSEDVRLKFKELHGHNTGVYDYETDARGSVLVFPDYAKIYWPPPSWLSRS